MKHLIIACLLALFSCKNESQPNPQPPVYRSIPIEYQPDDNFPGVKTVKELGPITGKMSPEMKLAIRRYHEEHQK